MIQELIKNLKEDKELYYAYQANIAMAFKDEFNKAYEKQDNKGAIIQLEGLDIHEIANQAAKNFLDLLIQDDNESRLEVHKNQNLNNL